MSKLKELIDAIMEGKDVKKIKSLAKKIPNLNAVDEGSYRVQTPLEAVLNLPREHSFEVFKLLISLGADPLYKPNPERPSVMEQVTAHHPAWPGFYEPLKTWLFQDKDSPLFSWGKLDSHAGLAAQFTAAGLVDKRALPLHAAIASGRLDLVQAVVQAAGSIQKAGDFNRYSALKPAIVAACKGQANAMEMLRYLLAQGASLRTTDQYGLPAMHQAISAGVFDHGVIEDRIMEVMQLLLQHGASLQEITPNEGYTLLMKAMHQGYPKIFNFLLTHADAQILNHGSPMNPCYVIFQALSSDDNKLRALDLLQFFTTLKDKGAAFDKTIHGPYLPNTEALFPNAPKHPLGLTRQKISSRNISLLHYYVGQMTHRIGEDNFAAMDEHLQLIQTLIAHGANPQAKATFTLTQDYPQFEDRVELTAAEYAKSLINNIVGERNQEMAYLIRSYPNEAAFLKHIDYRPQAEQMALHKKFHQFRNLERALAGQSVLPYAGLPNSGKLNKQAAQQEGAAAAAAAPAAPVEDFSQIEQQLLQAQENKDKSAWQELKKSMVDFVKSSNSAEDFLARVEQLKKPLQLHFDVAVDPKSGAVSQGSLKYRVLHLFAAQNFSSTWEELRTFGHKTYGVDINAQYDGKKMSSP